MKAIKKEWIAWAGLAALLVYVAVVNMAYFGKLVSLPSPIYGGDYYYQLGHVYHFMQGGGFMQSSSLYDALPTYMPVYPWLIAKIAVLFGMSAVDAMFACSVVFTLLSLFLWFFFLRALFEEEYALVFVGLALLAFRSSVIIKYTDFAMAVHLPLFLLALYYFLQKRSVKTSIFLGVVYGLSALTYTIMFVGATLMLVMLLALESVIAWRKGKFKTYAGENARYVLMALAAAVPVALVYWYEPVFFDHLHMYYNRAKLDFPDFGIPAVQIAFLKQQLAAIFNNFSTVAAGLFTLLHIVSVGILIIDRGRMRFFVGSYFAASLLVVFSYFFTEPILDTNFIPMRLSQFFLDSSVLLLTLYGLHYLMGLLKFDARFKAAGLVALAVLLLVRGQNGFENRENDHWYQRGTQPMNAMFADLGNYLRAHTTAEDVVLTTKELGFALNAVSGNKLIAGRWAHNGSPYTDLSQRDVDLAIILYGKDDSVRKALLEKYGASYLFWNDYWMGSEYRGNNKGQIVDTYDPLIAFDMPQYREQLLKNDVVIIPRHFWLEPSVRQDNVRQYDILIVGPQNYRSFDTPWSPDLNHYLEKVWSYESNGREAAVLYKISY